MTYWTHPEAGRRLGPGGPGHEGFHQWDTSNIYGVFFVGLMMVNDG